MAYFRNSLPQRQACLKSERQAIGTYLEQDPISDIENQILTAIFPTRPISQKQGMQHPKQAALASIEELLLFSLQFEAMANIAELQGLNREKKHLETVEIEHRRQYVQRRITYFSGPFRNLLHYLV